jgi:hypothetical protein
MITFKEYLAEMSLDSYKKIASKAAEASAHEGILAALTATSHNANRHDDKANINSHARKVEKHKQAIGRAIELAAKNCKCP